MTALTQRQESATATNACPECSGQTEYDGAERVCTECGLVVDENTLDRGPDWSNFEDNASTRRASGTVTKLRHDDGIGHTQIGGNRDANGATIDRESVMSIRRAAKHTQFESKHARNRARGLGEVQRIGTALGLSSDRREQAAVIFRSAHDDGLAAGRCLDALAAAAILALARVHQLPTTREDIARVARVDADRIATHYDVVNRELGLPTPPPDPATHVPSLVDGIEAGEAVRREAARLIDVAKASDEPIVQGCRPMGVAAGAVYVAADRVATHRSQKRIADVADVSPVTLRGRYKEIEEADRS